MSPLIQAQNLRRYYANHCAVEDVSFNLQKGEILGFLGPNGAGKTTTMQMLCGNLAPSAGEVRINGIDLFERPRDAKAQIGYLPETPPLYRELTVDEYLHYCARLHGIHRARIAKAVDQAKARCSLGDVGKRLIGNLSKGFQQRVGIAQAILHLPAVIILDEPTVGLDPIQIRQIRGLIRDLGEEHGVILSTHILPEVQESCTRVQIIHQGKLVLNDDIEGLERRMGASSLILATESVPSDDRLTFMESVHSVEALEPNRLRIFYDNRSNPAAAIAETVVKAGWGLLELTPERRTMEEIFIDLTGDNVAEESTP